MKNSLRQSQKQYYSTKIKMLYFRNCKRDFKTKKDDFIMLIVNSMRRYYKEYCIYRFKLRIT